MIAEKATGKSFRDLVHEMVIEPQGLTSTFYEASTYPEAVTTRLSHGYFENEACSEYQPDCKQPWNAPLIGTDWRDKSVSWMQSAGGAVSSARDVDRWMRAVFGGKVVPPAQQKEWEQLVSMKTAEPIADVSEDEPAGFALGLGKRMFEPPLGAQWFYEGESLGYRTLYVWIADEDLMITVQTNTPAARRHRQDRRGGQRDLRDREEARVGHVSAGNDRTGSPPSRRPARSPIFEVSDRSLRRTR